MNKRQKEVIQSQLNDEKAVLKALESNYKDALDEINSKIELLMARQDADMQHVIYQVEYQKALKAQIQAILETLQANQFESISEYLTKSYEEGFLGTMYDLQGQGIPLVFPIDQAQVLEAIQTETNLSESLYGAMGKDIKDLQKKIAGEISRGLSTGMMYSEIARNIAGWARIPKNNAMRIARTEAHRIQCKAAYDAQHKAKSKGADVVKRWNATLDKRTRESHFRVDGEVRELDEKFSNGLLYPGDPDGRPEEVINCRCALEQKASWALDRQETEYLGNVSKLSDERKEEIAKKLKVPVEELELYSKQIVPINARNYEDFKRQYNQIWHYEGSDLQKEAEARIAGYKSQRVRSGAQKIKNGKNTLENNGKSSTIFSGAVSGARNPFGEKAKEHAEKYYGLVRSMKTDVAKISKATGMKETDVQAVKNFIFHEKHDLGGKELEYFEPDFMMAESWQRLTEGKPEKHDITLLKHELMEKQLIEKGLSQEEAHLQTSKKYNYSKEAGEYYAKIDKFKKE